MKEKTYSGSQVLEHLDKALQLLNKKPKHNSFTFTFSSGIYHLSNPFISILFTAISIRSVNETDLYYRICSDVFVLTIYKDNDSSILSILQ